MVKIFIISSVVFWKPHHTAHSNDDDQGYKWLGTEQEKYTSQKVNYKITLGHWKFMPAECVK